MEEHHAYRYLFITLFVLIVIYIALNALMTKNKESQGGYKGPTSVPFVKGPTTPPPQ